MTQNTMYIPPSIRVYCESCSQRTKLVKRIEEAYPGQYVTLFVSSCCDDMVRDELDKPIPFGMLTRLYEEQRSDDI